MRWSVDAAERGSGHGRPQVWDGEQWGLCHVAVLLGLSEGHVAVREEGLEDRTSESKNVAVCKMVGNSSQLSGLRAKGRNWSSVGYSELVIDTQPFLTASVVGYE